MQNIPTDFLGFLILHILPKVPIVLMSFALWWYTRKIHHSYLKSSTDSQIKTKSTDTDESKSNKRIILEIRVGYILSAVLLGFAVSWIVPFEIVWQAFVIITLLGMCNAWNLDSSS